MKHSFLRQCLLTFLLVSSFPTAFADEGMWIPALLGEGRIREMHSRGLRLGADDLYSINGSSLKDAIVLFGRGCTGAIVSAEGLLLTNHHCGFGQIQSHSTIEHDYLTDGFWAMSREEELPNPGLTVSLLVRMEDVTEKALAGVTEGMTEAARKTAIEETAKQIAAAATEGTHYQAEVRPLFAGNQYFLYVMEVFRDVRLVGAPPSAIGNFGGDTDNWMWPRHTGDFSVFRIYAGPDNKPAEYAESNLPYRPGKYLTVSVAGVTEDDFTMVYGFPAVTTEYLPASLVKLIAEHSYPSRIAIRQKKLDIIASDSQNDPAVRIQYASKRAGIANAWKKWIGVEKGLSRFGATDKKQEFEKAFQAWAEAGGYTAYAAILPAFDKLTADMKPVQHWIDHFSDAIWSLDIIQFAARFRALLAADPKDEETWTKESEKLQSGFPAFFRDFNPDTDKKLLIAMMEHFREKISPSELPDVYDQINKKFRGDITAFADWAYQRSMLVSETATGSFLGDYHPKDARRMISDPLFKVMNSFYAAFSGKYAAVYKGQAFVQDSLQRLYMKGIMEMQAGRELYPDANSTLRITYGKVDDYFPADAVRYEYYTTLAGVMEKNDPGIYDYRVPERLSGLYAGKDYGGYDTGGEMRICFIASNHTTGGNSGSPVLNGSGQLIGLNFDRNWEGTMSDISYDPEMCRNIVLDIRYCLFIIDTYAGAGHLLQEMTLVR
jgi:hypothetical protein